MYTEEERKEILKRIKDTEDSIKALQKTLKEDQERILKDNCQKVKERFPDIAQGDKVEVTRKVRFYESRDKEVVKEVLYFDKVAPWNYSFSTDINLVKWWFRKLKKDGTPSLRTVDYYNDTVINVVKL